MRAAAAIPAIGLLAGSAAGFLLPDLAPAIWYAVLAGLTVLAVLSGMASRGSRPALFAVAVAGAFAAGGARLAQDAWQRTWRPPLRVAFEAAARRDRALAVAEGRVLPEDDEAFAVVTGVLRGDAARGASSVSLSVAVDTIDGVAADSLDPPRDDGPRTSSPVPTGGGILVSVVGSLAAGRADEWRAGRRVLMPAELHRPTRYLDPGVPDNERALARSGTTLVGTVKSGALVEVLARGPWWAEWAGGVRLFSRRALAAAVGRWSAQSAAIVTAIVIGDRAGLDDDVRRKLQEAGTYHVIAISGGNIAILAGLLLAAFRLAGFLGRTAMFGAAGVLIAYAVLVGGGASVDRATLMAVLYFGSRAFDQRSPPLNALCMVAALLVAADPLSIADPAFVLTFGATLAILVVVPAVARPSTNNPARPPAVAGPHEAVRPSSFGVSTLARVGAGSAVSAFAAAGAIVAPMFVASLAAEGLLFPVGAIVFSRVTIAGLALNFLAIPLMGVAQIAGMVVVPCALISARLAAAAGFVAAAGAAGLVWSAELVRFAPRVTYRIAPPSWSVVIVYYMAIAVWWIRRRRRTVSGVESRPASRARRIALVAAGVSAVWILADPASILAARGDGRLHVTFLDVGQGDSLLVRFPQGRTMLVDAGGLTGGSGFDIGDRVVAPVLRQRGVRRLDYVVLTHGDPDHIGGAPSIVREFRPHEVWEGIPVPRFAPLTALRMEAQAAGARWANVYRPDRIVVDGVEIAARHPAPAEWERQRVRNDDSVVLDVRWRDVSILLTGDIGKPTERTLSSEGVPLSPIRILKVPHHGSLTSSSPEFLGAVRPQVAVFSAGRANHFGHPAPDVLQRYRDIGAALFRTDQDGAVSVDSDGYSIDVRTFTGRELHVSALPN